MPPFRFELLAEDAASGARRGRLHTAHGTVETPCFMPVGTRATVKAISQDDLEGLGAEIILANTYHLFLRPGHELIRALGGLHRFAAWPHPILTDSGGFQVFSLGALNTIEEAGVTFRSHLDGSQHQLTPELSIEVQLALGADIIMAFDDCTPYPATAEQTRVSLERTERWAERSREVWRAQGTGEAALFGIVQGGMYPALRREAAQRQVERGLPGYAIGGVSVGEPRELSYEAVAAAVAELPRDKPRYLMGVGTPEELVNYAALGIDMMDCVLPTRNARNGLLFTSQGPISIKNARHARDPAPLDANCGCRVCGRYSRAYLRHLYQSREILASQLNTHHNLFHYLDTMRQLRHAIGLGQLGPWRAEWSYNRSTQTEWPSRFSAQ
ncbi:MAG TPA: tRNA guanosine(34) transglycosylase Tgt [Terriglobales bacterium]|nr:tRNA guanosine(34) transglycosylase Tgt [Terriglobales bacterium]